MAYLTYCVQITRDESRPSGTAIVEITAYIDRVPETNEPEFVATDLVRVNEAPASDFRMPGAPFHMAPSSTVAGGPRVRI
jgi:hypothetical protein